MEHRSEQRLDRVYQLHICGASGSQAKSGPFVLRTVGYGMLHFQLTAPAGSTRIWSTKFPVNRMVVAFSTGPGLACRVALRLLS